MSALPPPLPQTLTAHVGLAARLALAMDSKWMRRTWPPWACLESRGLLPSAMLMRTAGPVATALSACTLDGRPAKQART